MGIVILSIVGIVLEEMESGFININPTIIRVMRVLRIARGKQSCYQLYVYTRPPQSHFERARRIPYHSHTHPSSLRKGFCQINDRLWIEEEITRGVQ